MTLIHKNDSFPRKIKNIATPNKILPYLQTIEIQNKPLKPLIIINLYMSTHHEDLTLVPIIKNTIHTTLNTHQSHTIILLRDFNRNTKLIGRNNNQTWTPPTNDDIEWAHFMNTQQLTSIPTNTTFSRQGGKNYTSTNLIDGYYIKATNTQNYKSYTMDKHNLNSDHYPISLNP
jgi:hypothetical protein